jgi:mono/diheme cytochrome c family protein
MAARLGRVIIVALAACGLIAVAAAIALIGGGISTRREPGPMETAVARRLRSLAIPNRSRSRANTVRSSIEALDNGRAHFADHCAGCHGNDGSGQTEIGRGLYPRPPDLRQPATQRLSDGELFYIIENGVKLTGMPAFGTGTAEGEHGSWELVHFIRHLPHITPSELERMKALNPKSPDEWRKEEDERRFLAGEDQPRPMHEHGERK